MAIAACSVFQREISRSVFWDFFDSIGRTRKSRPVQLGPVYPRQPTCKRRLVFVGKARSRSR